MNPPKCDDLDYIHFLIATQRVFPCTDIRDAIRSYLAHPTYVLPSTA